MTLLVLRHLPTVAEIERQLDLEFRGHLLEDELEELPHLIDEASLALFGITQRDTFYSALPEEIRGKYDRREWEAHFEVLGHYARDPNAHWRKFGLDLCCDKGRSLHCIDAFGRQLVCALNGLHPQALLAFANRGLARAA